MRLGLVSIGAAGFENIEAQSKEPKNKPVPILLLDLRFLLTFPVGRFNDASLPNREVTLSWSIYTLSFET
jgi:hypothetical protein